MDEFDLLVVGGGINGTGIARDAVGRGLSVCLCEADDLAAHTSSASTKLVHGGLRYLEQYEFKLVSEALAEREVLLRIAPHIVHPLRFVLPHEPHLRPVWMIRAGLFLYDHLGHGKRTLPGSRRIDLRTHVAGRPLRGDWKTGFVYSDTRTRDARLVVLNAMDAAEHGATILVHTRCTEVRHAGKRWHALLEANDGTRREVTARALVNAAGPWAARFLDHVVHSPHRRNVRLVKGSHIVVPRLYAHDYAYTFQLPDRRIVFAIPYEGDYTLIGTTDVEYPGDPSAPHASPDEIQYLCNAVNRYFTRQITPSDVVWSYSGVRPLVEDSEASPSEVTRGYRLEVEVDAPPLLSVFGGKLTTHRELAEEALNRLAPLLPGTGPAWTATGAPLPGGDRADLDAYRRELLAARPWLPETLATRLVSSYGTRTPRVLGEARSIQDLGPCYGADLYQREVDYLRTSEWARTSQDILWRRSKLGLRFTAEGIQQLDDYLRDVALPISSAPVSVNGRR